MATIAIQPQAARRSGPWWVLFLIAAAGIAGVSLVLVRTMTSEGEVAGRTAAFSSVERATHTRALNQPEAASQIAGSTSFTFNAVQDLRALNEAEAATGGLDLAAVAEVRAANTPSSPAHSPSSSEGIRHARALNEPSSKLASSVEAVTDPRWR
ncbi:MAG TPA: hypothetical protein VF058_10070 [Actinomycetota bacterium]